MVARLVNDELERNCSGLPDVVFIAEFVCS